MTRSHLAAAIMALGILATILSLAESDQRQRVERLSAAETKYGAVYEGKSRDGEGGGLWTLLDGTTVTCRISGAVDDPTLACGDDGIEPDLATTSR